MAWWRLLGVVAMAAGAVAACGGGGESTSPSGGEGGFITGAGGGPAAGTGGTLPTTSGTGAATTTSTGTGGTGGMTSTTGPTGTGGGSNCVDIGLGEPNETESGAWPLKTSSIDDCDGSGDSITGVIGPGDVDWFYYEGDDATFCVVNPTRSLTQSQSGLRLCKFFECLNGNTEVNCPSGTTSETSAEDRPGCCGTSGFEVSDLNCTGTLDEHAYVYIRLDRPGGDASTCNEYALAYHY